MPKFNRNTQAILPIATAVLMASAAWQGAVGAQAARVGESPLPVPAIPAPPADSAQSRTTPTPGAEAALRKFLNNFDAGTPDYAIFTPAVAEALRKEPMQGPRLGAIRSLAFAGVDSRGNDRFLVTYERGRQNWFIQLDPAGKIFTIFARQVPSDLMFASDAAGAERAVAAAPRSAASSSPVIQPAVDGIIDAFHHYGVVAISNPHGLAQGEDLWAALVRDPRFAREVGNVVVEGGASAHQATIDKFVNGEYVAYADLQKIWLEGGGGASTSPGIPVATHPYLYAAIRQANAELPPDQRIKIWLGEPRPPVDRNTFPAGLINNILEKSRKVLVLYGFAHISPLRPGNIRRQVEERYPGAFLTLTTFTGLGTEACSQRLGQSIGDAVVPALVTSIRGSTMEPEIRRPGCAPPAVSRSIGSDPEEVAQRQAANDRAALETFLDGFLYFGPPSGLMRMPALPELYLDLDYLKALAQVNADLGRPASGPPRLPVGALSPRPFSTLVLPFGPVFFRANDRNADGRLDPTELRQALIQNGRPADQLESLARERDADGDGFVSQQEYLRPAR